MSFNIVKDMPGEPRGLVLFSIGSDGSSSTSFQMAKFYEENIFYICNILRVTCPGILDLLFCYGLQSFPCRTRTFGSICDLPGFFTENFPQNAHQPLYKRAAVDGIRDMLTYSVSYMEGYCRARNKAEELPKMMFVLTDRDIQYNECPVQYTSSHDTMCHLPPELRMGKQGLIEHCIDNNIRVRFISVNEKYTGNIKHLCTPLVSGKHAGVDSPIQGYTMSESDFLAGVCNQSCSHPLAQFILSQINVFFKGGDVQGHYYCDQAITEAIKSDVMYDIFHGTVSPKGACNDLAQKFGTFIQSSSVASFANRFQNIEKYNIRCMIHPRYSLVFMECCGTLPSVSLPTNESMVQNASVCSCEYAESVSKCIGVVYNICKVKNYFDLVGCIPLDIAAVYHYLKDKSKCDHVSNMLCALNDKFRKSTRLILDSMDWNSTYTLCRGTIGIRKATFNVLSRLTKQVGSKPSVLKDVLWFYIEEDDMCNLTPFSREINQESFFTVNERLDYEFLEHFYSSIRVHSEPPLHMIDQLFMRISALPVIPLVSSTCNEECHTVKLADEFFGGDISTARLFFHANTSNILCILPRLVSADLQVQSRDCGSRVPWVPTLKAAIVCAAALEPSKNKALVDGKLRLSVLAHDTMNGCLPGVSEHFCVNIEQMLMKSCESVCKNYIFHEYLIRYLKYWDKHDHSKLVRDLCDFVSFRRLVSIVVGTTISTQSGGTYEYFQEEDMVYSYVNKAIPLILADSDYIKCVSCLLMVPTIETNMHVSECKDGVMCLHCLGYKVKVFPVPYRNKWPYVRLSGICTRLQVENWAAKIRCDDTGGCDYVDNAEKIVLTTPRRERMSPMYRSVCINIIERLNKENDNIIYRTETVKRAVLLVLGNVFLVEILKHRKESSRIHYDYLVECYQCHTHYKMSVLGPRQPKLRKCPFCRVLNLCSAAIDNVIDGKTFKVMLATIDNSKHMADCLVNIFNSGPVFNKYKPVAQDHKNTLYTDRRGLYSTHMSMVRHHMKNNGGNRRRFSHGRPLTKYEKKCRRACGVYLDYIRETETHSMKGRVFHALEKLRSRDKPTISMNPPLSEKSYEVNCWDGFRLLPPYGVVQEEGTLFLDEGNSFIPFSRICDYLDFSIFKYCILEKILGRTVSFVREYADVTGPMYEEERSLWCALTTESHCTENINFLKRPYSNSELKAFVREVSTMT